MGKSTTDDNKHEQPLQAVLIADNFNNAWHPITLEAYDGSIDGGKGKERPSVLCPLNNVPLLKLSIDFLQVSSFSDLLMCFRLAFSNFSRQRCMIRSQWIGCLVLTLHLNRSAK